MGKGRKLYQRVGLGLLGLLSFVVGMCVVNLFMPKRLALDSTHFPDEVLRSHIASAADLDGDGGLSAQEISGLTSLRVSGVRDLSGLENLTSLKTLVVGGDTLTEIELSHMSALVQVRLEKAPNLTVATFRDCPVLESTDFEEAPALETVTYEDTPCLRETIVHPSVSVVGDVPDSVIHYLSHMAPRLVYGW